MGVIDREQAGIDHRLRVAIAFQRLSGRIRGGGDGVTDLGLADVLGSGDHVTDLTGSKCLGRHHVGADHADFYRIMGHADTHHVQFLTGTQFAVDHTDIGDDASVGVIDRIEDQRAGGSIRLTFRSRYIGDDAIKQFGHAFAGLAGDA